MRGSLSQYTFSCLNGVRTKKRGGAKILVFRKASLKSSICFAEDILPKATTFGGLLRNKVRLIKSQDK